MSDHWTPKKGDTVWLNYPDSDEPEGVVVGFVPESNQRAGQPIIERTAADEDPSMFVFAARKQYDRFVIHPRFLLPFPYGGDEWQRANAEGRIG